MPKVQQCRQCGIGFVPERIVIGHTETDTEYCRVCRALATKTPDTFTVGFGNG